MSRTYRKRDPWFGSSKANHIKSNLRWRHLRTYSTEDLIKEASEEWDEACRDGHWGETGRNQYFKWLAKHEERNKWRVLSHKIINGYDCDDEIMPCRKHGKKHFWSVW